MTEPARTLRVAIVGMGIIGKRLAHSITRQPDMRLAGVAVRSAGPAVLAQPKLRYYASVPSAAQALRDAGIRPAGDLDDLLHDADVVVDAGPSSTGVTRAAHYGAAAVAAVFCGGERDPALGPLVHSALNYGAAAGGRSVRLPSCNTTALGRVVAAIGTEQLLSLDATVLRCATDTDKAAKGNTNGAVAATTPSHHASDLCAIIPELKAQSRAVTLPMTCGHVILVRLVTTIGAAAAFERLRRAARVSATQPGMPLETASIRAASLATGRRWGERFELIAARCGSDEDELILWLSLDNESITMPEALDVLRCRAGVRDAAVARSTTDQYLTSSTRIGAPQAGALGAIVGQVHDNERNDHA